MITWEDYLMGRDAEHGDEITQAMRDDAALLLKRVNALLTMAAIDGVYPGIDQHTGTPVASGWRPAHINDRTANAAKGSNHITMRAIDVQDTPDRAIARWCLAHIDVLINLGLWIERPQWTGGADPWVHFQKVPPGSGHRVYVPTQAPPLCAALPGELEACNA